ncbi:hypothetical protein Vi05172_g5570 [Venturia inaequalis]|nr:hypothetical protein Vi05172_g5570 [Venturia inaequalis]
MKVTIKQWNAVAAWRWDMPEDDVCGICRNPYDTLHNSLGSTGTESRALSHVPFCLEGKGSMNEFTNLRGL